MLTSASPAQVASLFDGSAPYGPIDVLVNNAGTYPSAPLRLDADDFEPYDGVTEDSRASGHGFARRTFQLSDRFFVLFAEAGERMPSGSALAGVNELLASLVVEPGDFYPGTVAPARLPRRAGWFVGTSGEDEARAEGEFTTSWASTIPYADEWNVLPPFKTLTRLPRDGIVIWLSLSRTNRFPPRPAGDETFRRGSHHSRSMSSSEEAGWEGQVRGLPEYLLLGTVRGEYNVDLRVYFGRPDPTPASSFFKLRFHLCEALSERIRLTAPSGGRRMEWPPRFFGATRVSE